MNRFALTADIHGNFAALEAVLADIQRRGVKQVFDLGDSAQGGLHPDDVIRTMRVAKIPSIRGNADRILLMVDPTPGYEADYAFGREKIAGTDLQWFSKQPFSRVEGDCFLCHGTPKTDRLPLLETIEVGGVRHATEAEILTRLAGIPAVTLIAVGHSHVPRAVRLKDGRLCVNPGSVGLPAYQDDQPFPHVMESGSPHARYAIVERRDGEWQVEHHAVSYDWESVAKEVEARGRHDRAGWIRTGRATAVGMPYATDLHGEHRWYERPVLFVDDIQRAIQFYVTMLGFEKAWHEGDGAGKVCQVYRSGCEIILCEDKMRTSRGRLYIELTRPGLAALWHEIIDRGVPNRVAWWGNDVIQIEDPDGNELYFPTPTPIVT